MTRLLPRSLFGRLVLVLLAGLALAQLASAYINISERDRLLYRTGGMQLAQRVADISKLLDSFPAAERRRIVSVFNAPPLAISLDRPRLPGAPAESDSDVQLEMFSSVVRYALGEEMEVKVIRPPGAPEPAPPGRRIDRPGMPMMHSGPGMRGMGMAGAFFVVQVALRDGTWVTFDSYLPPQDTGMPLRLAATLLVLLGSVIVLSLVAVRWVTRPLSTLATAAEQLGEDINRPPLPETGPAEVQRAAKAFNTMQQRLSRFIADRTRILTAMSHDLKTPLTRLRLRSEMLEDEALRAKFSRDMEEMETMIAHTLDFMRDARTDEPVVPVDIMALLESLQTDYADTGAAVDIEGSTAQPYPARHQALRRCLANLLDNAIRYGRRATVDVRDTPEQIVLRVLDEGPGIQPDELERAFEPFFRGETSRNRETGGTGLGLGIARNIARAHGGELTLQNRPAGGLEARLTLPRARRPLSS